MAKIAPFRGIRYDTAVVDPNLVTSPPYDVISPAENESLHNRHPKNFVRLILGQDLPGDTPETNRFTRAAGCLQEWLADGTLKQDEKPAIYVYEQHFDWKGQERTIRGFLAAVKLQSYDENVILPHEQTLAKPKSHLVPLIHAVRANLDSVFGLYPDPEHTVDAVLDRAASGAPAMEAFDAAGVRHRIWIVQDQSQIDLIASTLSDRQIVIADGHHRYETSLAYRDELRAADGNPREERSYDYLMMTLVNVYAPDVIVFPTHRMARNLSAETVENIEMSLAATFDVVESSRELIISDMEKLGGSGVGIYRPGRAVIAVPKEGAIDAAPGAPALKKLDLFVLHKLILEDVLGIDAERLRQEANIVYTRSEDEALDKVDSGEFQMSFLLNPMKLESVLMVAQAGEKMPQKATYFYPKPLSGLVVRKIE